MDKSKQKKLKKQYKNTLKQLIDRLNKIQGAQCEHQTLQILTHIRMADQDYLKNMQLKIKGHVMLTRHGQCRNWSQKRFGLNPNAALDEDSVKAMKITSKLTKGFLCFPNSKLIVNVSPMVRAKQTASLIVPKCEKIEILIEPSLVENSKKPSSLYLTSLQQLKSQYSSASFMESPKKTILFKLSQMIYGQDQIYENMKAISTEADRKILEISENSDEYYKKGEFNEQKSEYEFDMSGFTKKVKINNISQIIKSEVSNKLCDLWFIGHSKNLKHFCISKLGLSSAFQFCETRTLYATGAQQQQAYFSPPYYLVIDQLTGLIKGKYDKSYFRLPNINS